MIDLGDVAVRIGSRLVLDGVTLDVPRGAFVCILGPNGAGKTTLLRAIAGLLASEGRITLGGSPIVEMTPGERARRIAYLPQGHLAHWPITARDAVAIGRLPHGGGPSNMRPADTAAVERAMAATDVVHLAGRPVTDLSGGERARVMLARALAVESDVLLADEPIAALDPAHQLRVMEVLAGLARSGTTVLAALHDLTLAARFAGRVVVLDAGRIAADGFPPLVLDEALLAQVFGITAAVMRYRDEPVILPWLPRSETRR